jgi:hypothetical protein
MNPSVTSAARAAVGVATNNSTNTHAHFFMASTPRCILSRTVLARVSSDRHSSRRRVLSSLEVSE